MYNSFEGENWEVKIDGQEAIFVATTQNAATQCARTYAQDRGCSLIKIKYYGKLE